MTTNITPRGDLFYGGGQRGHARRAPQPSDTANGPLCALQSAERLALRGSCADEPEVVEATPWRWVADDIVAVVVLRRRAHGAVWDLRVEITVDPDDLDRCDYRVAVVRGSGEVETAHGLEIVGPVLRWLAGSEVLADAERDELHGLAQEAAADPPTRGADSSGGVPLELPAGSLGTLQGTLAIDPLTGIGSVVVLTLCGERQEAAGVDEIRRALRAAVIDGRCRVPSEIRARIELGSLEIGGAP